MGFLMTPKIKRLSKSQHNTVVSSCSCQLVINVLCLLLLGKVLEPVWGSKELLKFIVTVNACTAVCTFVVMIVLYYSSLSDKFL